MKILGWVLVALFAFMVLKVYGHLILLGLIAWIALRLSGKVYRVTRIR